MLVIFYGVDNTKKTTRVAKLAKMLTDAGFRTLTTKRPTVPPPLGLSTEEMHRWMHNDAVDHYLQVVHPVRENTIVLQDRGTVCAEVYNREVPPTLKEFYTEVCRFNADVLGHLPAHAQRTSTRPDLHILCTANWADMQNGYKRKGEELTASLLNESLARQDKYRRLLLLEEEERGIPLLRFPASHTTADEDDSEAVYLDRMMHYITSELTLMGLHLRHKVQLPCCILW